VHTNPPNVDLAALVPGLAPYARTAALLHPRAGTASADLSHIGGPIRWPADEPWPICHVPGERTEVIHGTEGVTIVGLRAVAHPMPNPLIVVAQLWAVDVPGLWCPPDTDLLQVLWCPTGHDHDQGATPAVHVVWRRHEPSDPIANPPQGFVDDELYVPNQCVLAPEQFTEFPDELPDDLANELENADIDLDVALHPIPVGSKVGGWPRWVYHEGVPTTYGTCGTEMRLLLMIDTCEDGDIGPSGIVVGRWSNLHFFVCTTCPGHPVRVFM
jgi:hypothetical protein